MNNPTPVPATLVELGSAGPDVRMRFLLPGGDQVAVCATATPVVSRILPHIHALHGHAPRCAGKAEVHVDLLLRCCHVIGGTATRLLVRPDPPAAFWLEVARPCGARVHLDLGLPDAIVLLASRRLPIAVDRVAGANAARTTEATRRTAATSGAGATDDAADVDWDTELRRLLER